MDENQTNSGGSSETGGNTVTGMEPKKNPLMMIVSVVLIVVAIAFFFLRNDNANEGRGAETMRTDKKMMDQKRDDSVMGNEAMMAGDTKNITMEASSFYYSVKEIRVKEGEKVKITMTGKDMIHDLNIDELGVKSEIVKAGGTVTIEFVASKKGTFEYYCSIGQHRKNGQVGKIIVE